MQIQWGHLCVFFKVSTNSVLNATPPPPHPWTKQGDKAKTNRQLQEVMSIVSGQRHGNLNPLQNDNKKMNLFPLKIINYIIYFLYSFRNDIAACILSIPLPSPRATLTKIVRTSQTCALFKKLASLHIRHLAPESLLSLPW